MFSSAMLILHKARKYKVVHCNLVMLFNIRCFKEIVKKKKIRKNIASKGTHENLQVTHGKMRLSVRKLVKDIKLVAERQFNLMLKHVVPR